MASEVNHHVGYSLANECWFVRFYPYQTEQQAKDAVSAFTRPAPATDTVSKDGTDGLVKLSVELTPSGYPYMKSDPEGDYVTRSQAESEIRKVRKDAAELLAAKDEIIERHREAQVILGKQLDEVIADNAAKDARIKVETELRKDHQQRNKELEAKLAAAEKALEPFAAIKTADGPEGSFTRIPDEHGLMFNMGTREPYFTVGDVRRARAVLGRKPS